VVIDLTTWGSTLERSRLPAGAFNPFTGYVDILINPDGTVVSTTLYSSPSTFGMSAARAGPVIPRWRSCDERPTG
jgi:hypothetical protein